MNGRRTRRRILRALHAAIVLPPLYLAILGLNLAIIVMGGRTHEAKR